jgi:hypothetical protein
MPKATTKRRWLTPPGVGDYLAIDPSKVLVWIRSGELVATNVATGTAGRPRWRIDPTDLELFLLRRRAQPVAKAPRRKRPVADVIEFF